MVWNDIIPNMDPKEKRRESWKRYRLRHLEERKLSNKKWIENNRERYNASKWIYADRLKRNALLHYGNGRIECQGGCGCTDIDLLTLDHIHNDGAENRRAYVGSKSGGINMYHQLRTRDYPDIGLQVLCINCNWKKEMMLRWEKRSENVFWRKYVKSVNI